MNKNYVLNSNKKLLHVYICCARPNGRTVRHIKKGFDQFCASQKCLMPQKISERSQMIIKLLSVNVRSPEPGEHF